MTGSRRCPNALGFVLLLALLVPNAAAAQIAPLSVPDLPTAIPLFPLPNVAVLPYLELPLHVFEPRYREMLADAMSSDRVIGIVQIQPGFEGEIQGRPPLFSIGTAAIVVRSEPQPDGTVDIVVRAFSKFRITGETVGRAYRIAQVEAIPEFVDETMRAALAKERPSLEAAFARSLGAEPGTLRLPQLSDEGLVNLLVMNLDLDTLDRQVLVEQPDALARARKLIELLSTSSDRPAAAPR